MIIEISGAALGGAALTLLTTYIKARVANGNGNGNGNGVRNTPCAQHAVMEQKFAEGGRRFEQIEEKLDSHSEALTSIQSTVSGLDSKLDTAIRFLRDK